MSLEGRLCSGLGEGALFTSLDWVASQFREKLGYVPHPGTLNLSMAGELWQRSRQRLLQANGIVIEPRPGYCAARCFELLINDSLRGAALLPDVAGYPADKLEIVAPVAVRQQLRLRDGDRVTLRIEIK
jgi:CTP-dependent riboflavin kinase